MKIAIDVALGLILLVCAWIGYRKGLVAGIGGLLAIAVSLYASTMLANTFSNELVPVLYPFASGYMESLMSNEVSEALGIAESDLSLDDYFAQHPEQIEAFYEESYQAMGIYKTEAGRLAEQAMDCFESSGLPVRSAGVQTLCETIAHIGILLIGALLILILITAIANIPNLSFRIPNHDILNDVGGAITGLLRGVVFCMAIVWVLSYLGIIIGSSAMGSTIVAKLIAKVNVLSWILGL